MDIRNLQKKNMVNATVRVGGKKVRFVHLKIEQVYGDHHYFTLQLDHDIAGKAFMSNPTEQMELTGRFVIIDIQHGDDNRTAYVFKGIITKVTMTGKDGKNGYLELEGASPTIMLERGKRMDIYSNTNLYNIFKKLIDGVYSDYMKYLDDPTYKNKIDFLMQYNETDWEFLKRISYLYGENLFYSGSEILFGTYDEWEAVKLTYDKEISDIKFCSQMLPNRSINYQYMAEQDTIIEKESPDHIENSNSYLDTMEEQNIALTRDKPAKNLIGAPTYNGIEMGEMVKRDKTRTAARTIYITGKSKTYESTIGRLITICMPEGMAGKRNLGTYRVVKSVHTIDERLRYSNEFEAVPASLTTMPVAKPKMPIAESVLGKVTSNEDPKGMGRVQVDLAFANQNNRIWMRVMSPSAGSSDVVGTNRGMVFVPEKGDQVMIGFEYGDPNRPYVMGSMFHAKNGTGGGSNNAIKSIILRCGTQVIFNDDKGSIHIEVPSGTTMDLDGKGNMDVIVPKTFTLKCKNMNLEVEENMTSSIGQDMITKVKNNQTTEITETLEVTCNNSVEKINQESKIDIVEKLTENAGEVERITKSGNMVIISAGKALIEGTTDARISKK